MRLMRRFLEEPFWTLYGVPLYLLFNDMNLYSLYVALGLKSLLNNTMVNVQRPLWYQGSTHS